MEDIVTDQSPSAKVFRQFIETFGVSKLSETTIDLQGSPVGFIKLRPDNKRHLIFAYIGTINGAPFLTIRHSDGSHKNKRKNFSGHPLLFAKAISDKDVIARPYDGDLDRVITSGGKSILEFFNQQCVTTPTHLTS